MKQAGNGPSRRHIQGSNIAKGLQGVKYSLLQDPLEEKIEKKSDFFKSFFFEIFFEIFFRNFFGLRQVT